MKQNAIFYVAVCFVLFIITYQLCARALPLLNGNTTVAYNEGLALVGVAIMLWIIVIILGRRTL